MSVTSADTGEATVSASTLTFTSGNWDSAQTVTVTGVDDATVDGSQVTTVTISVVDAESNAAYRSLADQSVIVSTLDNDSGSSASINLSTSTAVVSEAGSTSKFTVVLGAQPSSDVVLSVVSQDVGEVTVFPPLLRFSNTNWNTQQTVIVTGIDDKTIDGIQSTPIVISVVDPVSDASYESVANQTVTASTTDNDYDDSDDYLDFVIEMIDVKIDDMVDVLSLIHI